MKWNIESDASRWFVSAVARKSNTNVDANISAVDNLYYFDNIYTI